MKKLMSIIFVMVLCLGFSNGANAYTIEHPDDVSTDLFYQSGWVSQSGWTIYKHDSINNINGEDVTFSGGISTTSFSSANHALTFQSSVGINYISIQGGNLGFVVFGVTDTGGGNYNVNMGNIPDYLEAAINLLAQDKCIANLVEIKQYSTSAVPVPAAVWLLGSGFVGLVSIRRKMKR